MTDDLEAGGERGNLAWNADQPRHERFERMTLPHLDAAYSLARWLTRNDADACDVVQEAFLRAYRGLPKWRGDSAFSTWLFALATNVYRSELKRFPTVNLPIEEIAEPGRAADQLTKVEARSQYEVVRRAVLALPKRYREPVVLFYFHEKDVAAAARTMGLPEGTVKARLSRARELLRRRFPQLEKEHAGLGMASTGKEAGT